MRITYHNTIVTVSATSHDDKDFDDKLHKAHHILSHFHRSSPGSIWGCDGIGYMVQKGVGEVLVNKSGVGPRKYQQGLREAGNCKCLLIVV